MFRPMQSALAIRRQRSRKGGGGGGKRKGKRSKSNLSYDSSPRPSIISINDERYRSQGELLRKNVSLLTIGWGNLTGFDPLFWRHYQI